MIQYVIPTKDNANKLVTSISTMSTNTKIHIESENESIFKKYNNALDKMEINDDDVIVFLHDDIEIRDEHIEKKLELYFKYRPNVGIAGVIGTNLFDRSGGWWLSNRMIYSRGRIIQGFDNGTEHPMIEVGGMDDSDIVSVDGCILFIKGSVAKYFRFDNNTYDGYHFYDVDTCFSLMEQGWHVGIIDILVKHDSEGPLSESWISDRDKFIKKWEDKGYIFPITKKQFKELKK